MQFPNLLALPAALALAVAVGACGGGESGGGHQAQPGQHPVAKGIPAERAFLSAMVPHHESAIEMARVAQERAKSPEIGALANSIIAAQEKEIARMRGIHERLFGSELRPDEGAHEGLGLSAREAGMNHMDSARELERENPFDRAFVDQMVPHHEGAIRMAEAVLARTGDGELRALAEGIVSMQKKEIAEMNAFREREHGAPVPKREGPMPEHGGGHSG